MKTKVVMIEAGMARLAMIVVRQSRMKSMIVTATSTAAITRWKLHFLERADDEHRLVLDHEGLDVWRKDVFEFIETLLHRFDHLDGVGARLLLHDEADGVFAVQPGQAAGLLEGVFHPADVLDPHRIAVLVGDDQSRGNPAAFSTRPMVRSTSSAVALVDAPAGEFQVLPHQRLADVLDREVVGWRACRYRCRR